jgi:hypothetical protein
MRLCGRKQLCNKGIATKQAQPPWLDGLTYIYVGVFKSIVLLPTAL